MDHQAGNLPEYLVKSPMAQNDSWYGLFLQLVTDGFIGGTICRESRTFTFDPRLVRPYDLLRKRVLADDFDRYLDSIDQRFFEVAKSELYRTGRGWIARGTASGKIRIVRTDSSEVLVPMLSPGHSIGIDSSSIGDLKVIGIFVLPDERSAYAYLERHLRLPKTHNHEEIRWSKLNKEIRETICCRFNEVVSLCCDAALIIKTNVLSGVKSHASDRIINLVDGCFSGYENTVGQKRKLLRARFFRMLNNKPVHCDPDFSPLSPGEVVRLLVRRLSKEDGQFAESTPLVAELRSHESQTIQVADVLVGATRKLLQEGKTVPYLHRLHFDLRRIRSYPKTTAHCYYFVKGENGSGASSR